MARAEYHWKRFWVPREGEVNLSEGGYLAEPDGPLGRSWNPDAVPFEALRHISCLALLGEPGSGKSRALEALKPPVSAPPGPSKALWVDLRSYSSDYLLYRAIFESEDLHLWRGGDYVLEVVLDSLDECLVHVRTVASLLADNFRLLPTNRLKLRIACRSAEWPQLLEEELPRIWGDQNFGSYVLAPLRRIDVELAARSRGISPDRFVEQIRQKDAVPLAIKPITLNFLIDSFESGGGQLATVPTELYHRGCLRLSAEENPSRKSSGAVSNVDPHTLLDVAGRIAAAMMFCKRARVFSGDTELGTAEGDITISEIMGTPHSQGCAQPVSAEHVRAALRTALFIDGGANRFGWSHWSYAEFLAARFVANSRLTTDQLCSLVFHPDPAGLPQVVPQLHEVAAWIAAMRPDFIPHVMQFDPQTLLRSSLASTDPGSKRLLTEALLRLFRQGKITDTLNFRQRYDVLNHPTIAEQLRPVVVAKTEGVMLRRVCIDIAEACNLQVLVDDLVRISMDDTEAPHIRDQAAHAVARIGDAATKARLLPLLSLPPEQDPDDQLKGDALRALWPARISAEQLFESLTPSKRKNFFGSYLGFVAFELPKSLTREHLPAALPWVAKQSRDWDLSPEFRSLAAEILRLAWRSLDSGALWDAFTDVIIARVAHHDPVIPKEDRPQHDVVAADPGKRRALLTRIIERLPSKEPRIEALVFGEARLATIKDLPWLVEQCQAAPLPESERWALLIRTLFLSQPEGYLDLMLDAKSRIPPIAAAFGDLFDSIPINSALADRLREKHAEYRDLRRQLAKAPVTHPPLPEMLEGRLVRFETGDLDEWWKLNRDMTLPADTDYYPGGAELVSDLTQLPGWQAADSALRARILRAAERYVTQGEPHNDSWLGQNILHRPAAAGYRAIRLLLKENPEAVARIRDADWAKWAGIIIGYPESPGVASAEVSEAIASAAYSHAPEAVIAALLKVVAAEKAGSGRLFVARKLDRCWDDRLARELFEWAARQPDLKPAFMGDVLDLVLPVGGTGPLSFAQQLLQKRGDGGSAPDMALEAAVAMLNRIPGNAWPTIWTLLQTDVEFGRKAVAKLAVHHEQSHVAKIASELPEEDVAQLYRWIAEQFPRASDPARDDAHFVGERESIADFRDALLRRLRERGSREAVAALEKLVASFPELRHELHAAREVRLRRSWQGVTPTDLWKLLNDPQVRLVGSADRLLELVVDSIRRYESKLHGETPAVADLWNDNRTPKSENHLSNHIKRHLLEDLRKYGAIAHREVEIREGEETDIHIDLVTVKGREDSAAEQLRVIIETKGCWNRDLKTAMQTQLRNRYLSQNPCQHGLYLVGWFLCPRWDKADYRYHDTPKWSLEDARKFFHEQAASLSVAGTTIAAFVLDTGLG